ncbi:CgeB family protein [Virgibacillus salexigens]|uniref:CgeB family protein n=1 Tax=Virgibacillus salexigens TaxID=61016 RepID=UPI00190E305E|nr:glycosyltransferase [Virgibacillus salexigens]
MNVLYIPSGYSGIYTYFDQWIYDEINKCSGLTTMYFSLRNGGNFQHVCQQFKPDMILTILGDHLPIYILETIQSGNFKSVLWLTEDPYYTDRSIKILPYFDYIFSIDSNAVAYYKRLGHKNVHHLMLGTNPSVFSQRSIERQYDICMVGYPYLERIRLVLLILEKTSYTMQLIGNNWRAQWIPKSARSRCKVISRWIPPNKVADFYSNSKIILNTLRPHNEPSNQNTAGILNQSVNNRMFDIASCGSFALMEYIDELPTYFQEGKEIVSFQTDEDCIYKISQYLNKNELRQEIAESAKDKVLRLHTFASRVEEMIGIVRSD